MDLLEKFEACKITRTYRRINSEYRVNIFLGYNDNGNMSMVITEFGHIIPVKSSKFIDVSLKNRDDGRLALSFDLLNSNYKSLFLIFCKDIIVICENAGSDSAISAALIRWKYWRELFGKKPSSILDKSEIKGLVGELLVIEHYLSNVYDIQKVISGWRGPLLGHKDFEIDDTWYEVKTISESAIQVIISSLEQLDSNKDGHLLVCKLDESTHANTDATNLNSLVNSLVNKIEDPITLDLFMKRLNNMGYVFDPEYENYWFLYKGLKSYIVNTDFPCLKRSSLPDTIGNAKYTLLLNTLSMYKEEI